MPDRYVWLVWSSAFLVPWLGAYVAFPRHRKAMVWASLMTAPLGLTEPLFVPHYWNPPSLFDLARGAASTSRALFSALRSAALERSSTTC